MKKFLFIAATAALVLSAACTKTEVTRSMDEEHLIGFGAYAGRSIDTKASSDNFIASGTTFSATNQHIGVYAIAGNGTAADFMKDVDVTLVGNGATASQTYSPLKYWPKDETVDANKLSFFAYYPYNGAGITRTNLCTSRWGSIDFTAQGAAADQIDLMVSDAVLNQYYSTNSGVVPFVFHHALSRVIFYFKVDSDYHTAGTDIVVTDVKLSNIKTTGTFTLTGTYASSTWAANATPVATFSPAYPATYLTTTAAPTYADGNVFLMVPQYIEDAAILTVDYTVEDIATHVKTNNTATVQLNTIEAGGAAVTTWTKNMNIVYTITLSLKPIKFTATVTNWDETVTNAGVTL